MAKGLLGFIEGFFGKQNKDVAKLRPTVDDVISVRSQYESISDEELRAKRQEFSDRYNGGETLDEMLPEAYGVVWEACRRLTERKASWDTNEDNEGIRLTGLGM